MLTMILALSAPAHAADAKMVDTPTRGGLDFKTCAAASDDTWYWWNRVLYNVSLESTPSPSSRSNGNCFDIDAVTTSSVGQKKLVAIGESYAGEYGAKFYQTSPTTEHVVLSSETHEPNDGPVAVPVGPGLIDILDPFGTHMATLETAGDSVEHLAIGDFDDNGVTDFLFTMESGELWEAMNVNQGEFIHSAVQTVFYNY